MDIQDLYLILVVIVSLIPVGFYLRQQMREDLIRETKRKIRNDTDTSNLRYHLGEDYKKMRDSLCIFKQKMIRQREKIRELALPQEIKLLERKLLKEELMNETYGQPLRRRYFSELRKYCQFSLRVKRWKKRTEAFNKDMKNLFSSQ